MSDQIRSSCPRLGILTTHPIHYQVPLFRALHQDKRIELTVLYASMHGAVSGHEPGFGIEVKWDVPLLDGYAWKLVKNAARRPSVITFNGTHLPQLQDELRKLEADALLIPGWGRRCYLEAMYAARRLRLPLLMRGEARLMPTQSPWKRLAKRLLIRPLIKRTAAALPIGTCNREFYHWCGLSDARLFDALYYVNNEFFIAAGKEHRPERESLRKAWGIPPDSTVFLFAGKLSGKKRPLDLLTALATLNDRKSVQHRGAHVLIAGDGPLRKQCESFAQTHKLPVSFAGFLNQTELTRAYVASDCLVLPSDYRETWGLVVNEAMASGCTAVVSDQVGCVPDLITEAETGYAFPCGDTETLADKLASVAGDREHLACLKQNAFQRVQYFSIEQAADGVVAATRYVAGGRTAGSVQ